MQISVENLVTIWRYCWCKVRGERETLIQTESCKTCILCTGGSLDRKALYVCIPASCTKTKLPLSAMTENRNTSESVWRRVALSKMAGVLCRNGPNPDTSNWSVRLRWNNTSRWTLNKKRVRILTGLKWTGIIRSCELGAFVRGG